MKILLATTEAVPFCKTGGLGDVCGSLPVELEKLGHRPVVILPAFRQVFQAPLPLEPTGVKFDVTIGSKTVEGSFLKSRLPGSEVVAYFVKQDHYFDRDDLYGTGGADYKDNCERFVFFCLGLLFWLLFFFFFVIRHFIVLQTCRLAPASSCQLQLASRVISFHFVS